MPTTSQNIIQQLLDQLQLSSYLEISNQDNSAHFDAVKCAQKKLLHPNQHAADWNSLNALKNEEQYWDIVFIDGERIAETVHAEALAAFEILSPNGVLVIDDCRPPNEEAQRVPIKTRTGRGNVWKAWCLLRYELYDYESFVVDTEYGCGLFRYKKDNEPSDFYPTDYVSFRFNEQDNLNLKPIRYFYRWLEQFQSSVPKKAIYTAIIDAYDKPLPPPENTNFEAICFTNNKNIRYPGWQMEVVKVGPQGSVKTARSIKIKTESFLPGYTETLWVDGNIRMLSSPEKYIAEHFSKADFGLLTHPERNCIYDEAKACIRLKKDLPSTIQPHVQRYKQLGFPKNAGLISSGVLYRKHSSELNNFGNEWWNQVKIGSRRDQLSFNFVLWQKKWPFRIEYCDFNMAMSSYFDKGKHAKAKRQRRTR